MNHYCISFVNTKILWTTRWARNLADLNLRAEFWLNPRMFIILSITSECSYEVFLTLWRHTNQSDSIWKLKYFRFYPKIQSKIEFFRLLKNCRGSQRLSLWFLVHKNPPKSEAKCSFCRSLQINSVEAMLWDQLLNRNG